MSAKDYYDNPQVWLNKAVLYALQQGCFFPVPEPKAPYRVKDLRKWGAMQNLHNAIAEFYGRGSETGTPVGG